MSAGVDPLRRIENKPCQILHFALYQSGLALARVLGVGCGAQGAWRGGPQVSLLMAVALDGHRGSLGTPRLCFHSAENYAEPVFVFEARANCHCSRCGGQAEHRE